MTTKSINKSHKKTTIKKSDTTSDSLAPIDGEFLMTELQWLAAIIEQRHLELQGNAQHIAIENIGKPPTSNTTSPYQQTVADYQLNTIGRVLLALSVATILKPQLFDPLRHSKDAHGNLPAIIGGYLDKQQHCFYPTYQTALFLLAGQNDEAWFKYASQLNAKHPLIAQQILYRDIPENDIRHSMQAPIALDESYYNYFLTGEVPRLDYGKYFAATLLQTMLTYDDIILSDAIKALLAPIIDHVTCLSNGFYERNPDIKKGFTALFHGSPGTGKTLLASILANECGMDMYKVNLNEVASKYIGESEKKLEAIFNRLQGKKCMLFFDEADALFGKRTEVKESNDRYANQEVSYLLQRIETFDGLVILATNFQNNLDEAFKRRIDVMINIPRPQEDERELMWNTFLNDDIQFINKGLEAYLINEYGYTGANIKSIIAKATRRAYIEGITDITFDLIKPYLKIENEKAFGVNGGRIKPTEKYGDLNKKQ